MTQTKKKTLIVLGITLLLLFAFIVSMTVGQNAVVANADSTSYVNEAQQTLKGVMSNGEVNGNISNEGTRINDANDLRTFLESGSGKGWLAYDITDFSWDNGYFTKRSMSENVEELNGNGHTITLTADKIVADNPWVNREKEFADQALMTYAGTKNSSDHLDLYAGLIGYLRPGQTIRNCKFVYNKSVELNFSKGTDDSSTFGLVVAYSLGNIDNCSLEISGGVSFAVNDKNTGNDNTMSRHAIAMGGFVGTMSTNASVSNSKIVLNGRLKVTTTGGSKANGRTWAGGVVGWMANGSEIYNIVTEGTGNLEADTNDGDKGRSFAGIIAGICGGDNVLGADSVAGKVDSCGIINGVINNWEGFATYVSNDGKYSPTGSTDGKNTIQYLIIGFAGLETNPTQVVSNVFMKKDVYKGNTFSIGYDCATTKGTDGVNQGRYYSTNILIKDVLGQIDGSENYTTASDKHAYLAFSGTAIDSPVWAVYDIKDDSGILWSKSVDVANGPSTIEYYYDQATSIEDAKKFDITYTEIKRGEEANYEIKYAHGKAVYFTLEFPYEEGERGYRKDENNNIILQTVTYGEGLTAPSLKLYYDEALQQAVPIKLSDKSYWSYRSDSNNVITNMSNSDKVSPDTYRSFLYLESPVGRDYSYIQFINTALRYVSYIYDAPDFKAYKETYKDYEPVRNGEKLIDWQQRIIQTVEPKMATIDWGAGDIEKVGGQESDFGGNIVCYGRYKTLYNGNPVVFNVGVTADTLISEDEVCSVNYEYQRLVDADNDVYETVDSCVNAGYYRIFVNSETGLTNTNYALSKSDKHCIYLEIESLEVGLKLKSIDNMVFGELQNDGSYYIQVRYDANEINLKDYIEVTNVLDKDSSIIKFDYIPYGEGELDMKNVGKFEMTIGLVGGINSGNYDISSQITRYVVEIMPRDAIFTVEGKVVDENSTPIISYTYGYTFQEKVNKEVAVTTIDGIPMVFAGNKECYKIVDGIPQPIDDLPFNVGIYQVIFTFSNAMYNNYNEFQLTVGIEIKQREVNANYSGKRYMEIGYGETIDLIDYVKFDRQSGETGIYTYEYNYASPSFSLRKQVQTGADSWADTDIWVENVDTSSVVDAGRYMLKIDIAFRPALTNGLVINEQTRLNYKVVHNEVIIVITQKAVSIEIKDQQKTYGDTLSEPSGLAKALDSQRDWTYASGSDKFFDFDDIVILPTSSKLEEYASLGKRAPVDKYQIDNLRMTDRAHFDNPQLESYDKIDNYIVTVTRKGVYTVTEKTVKVKVILNTSSVVYGEELPIYLGVEIDGEGFFEDDEIRIIDIWGDIRLGSPVDVYELEVGIEENENNTHKNYKLQVVGDGAVFKIVPKTITIIDTVVGGDLSIYFDGEDHSGDVAISAKYAEEEELGEELFNINLVYNYFEIIDGVVSTEATEHPQYAGKYKVFISGVDNPNYNVVFDTNYERNSLEIEIKKIEVKVEVLNAYRIYSLEDSLTAYSQKFKFVDGTGFYDIDTSDGELYIDEYYTQLGWKEGVVKVRFPQLEKDGNSVDADGNWIIGEVEKDGDIHLTGYRNYDVIIVARGSLNVLSGDLSVVDEFITLQSYQEVYNGQNRVYDFQVLSSNDNIVKALKFRLFQYVAMSSLSKAEADSLAKAGKYSKTEDGNGYVLDNANGAYVRKFTDKAVNAGRYFYLITSADENAGIFTGESASISFEITKAERPVTENDITVSVNYNKITVSSRIEGMEISFNGGAFTHNNSFTGLKSNSDYTVKVRFAESANYKQSEEIELNLHTGINISSIIATLEKYNKIDFSNVVEYESKVLAYIGSVSQDDMATIDQAKLAKLQASYEQLIRGASSVIEDAQKVGATAVGKSGKTANKSVAMALSTGGLGVLTAGIMLLAKKKKDEQEDEREVKKLNRVNIKRASRVATAVVAIMLICVTVFAFAGCDTSEDDGAFSKADLYKIASFQGEGQDAGKRNLTIEVKSSGYTLYKYENGEEAIDSRLDVSSISFGADGIGFEFDDLYFANMQFEIADDKATFNADVKETLAFLGVNNATNGKVSVVVDAEKGKLDSLDVKYDIVSAGITYNVNISVKG